MHPHAAALLEHWLGPEAQRDAPAAELRKRWFEKSLAYDAELARLFGADLASAEQGAYDDWAAEPRGRLALILLLDQLTRNLRRDTAGMFDNDPKALALAREGIARGEDRSLCAAERNFLYMPFMHSESLEDQERAVALFRALGQEFPDLDASEWAVRHRDVIARFGRFPHRNALLGRTTTFDEVAFLQEHGGF